MTTTSEKILSEMERMGRMKIKDLCAQMHWQYQKFRRRIKANDFSPEDLAQGASVTSSGRVVEKATVARKDGTDGGSSDDNGNGENGENGNGGTTPPENGGGENEE